VRRTLRVRSCSSIPIRQVNQLTRNERLRWHHGVLVWCRHLDEPVRVVLCSLLVVVDDRHLAKLLGVQVCVGQGLLGFVQVVSGVFVHQVMFDLRHSRAPGLEGLIESHDLLLRFDATVPNLR